MLIAEFFTSLNDIIIISIIFNSVLKIIINSANITSLLICASSNYSAITQKLDLNIRFDKLMQSFTFFIPFNSSFGIAAMAL